MDNIIYILFICIIVPLVLMLPLLTGRSRLYVGYMIIGICACLFAAEINGYVSNLMDRDMYYITTNITPVIEEIIKALPVLYFAFIFSDNKEKLIPISFAVGVGFAVLENMVILVQNIDSISIFWALVRGFASGVMHGICTACVGFGISYVRKRRKLFYCGTFALLALAITYHASFNTLVQSDSYKYFGFVMPMVTYVPAVLFLVKNQKLPSFRKQG
ncbi:PrsW family glutamic-type intramembrane protease [Eubacterium oxidoreducens]|uniref:Protease prsW family protein n=1 Tax=Eubacterium oxidoreducens TaxID=1732 RepID=A0A1G6AG35_EUBOX|nr:PrsW family glutamic-type intramembrane protease [Eubacterium oxidoreducens]SDB07355.1 Protease prsW family protein [Eubacterium oxidoreducens]